MESCTDSCYCVIQHSQTLIFYENTTVWEQCTSQLGSKILKGKFVFVCLYLTFTQLAWVGLMKFIKLLKYIFIFELLLFNRQCQDFLKDKTKQIKIKNISFLDTCRRTKKSWFNCSEIILNYLIFCFNSFNY